MAWNIHWQTQFMSFNGTLYTVNVYDRDYVGEIEQLTPAAQPFTTQEDGSDDIFKPIRIQTGYLRVVTDDNTLLSRMMPEDTLSRFVRLMQGQDVKWQGFLSKQAYTQPYGEYTWQIEFALNSVLAMLNYVKPDIPLGVVSYREMFAAAFNYILADVDTPIRNVKLANMPIISGGVPMPQYATHEQDSPATAPGIASGLQFYEACVGDMSRYYEHYEIVTDRVHTKYQPTAPSRMFEDILTLIGACVREDGNDIIFIRFGKNTLYYMNQYPLYIVSGATFLAGGNTATASFPSVPSLSVGTMLTGNKINYLKGYEEVKVIFEPAEEEMVLWRLPKPFLKSDDKIDITNYGAMLFQVPRNIDEDTSNETFKYYQDDNTSEEITYTAARNIALGIDNQHTVQGAFPRWTSEGDTEDAVYSMLDIDTKWSTADRHYVYSFKVNMLSANASKMKLHMEVLGKPTIYVGFLNNGEYYNDSGFWTSSNVVIPVTSVAIPDSTHSNADIEINISGRSGIFEVIIYGQSSSYSKMDSFFDIVLSTNSFSPLKSNYTYSYTHDNEKYKIPLNSKNVYYGNIGRLGTMKTMNIPIGTFNGNEPLSNIIFVGDGIYIEKFAGKRPEQYLIETLTEYYSEKRRAITINCLHPLAKDAYYKDGTLFFAAIETRRQWRDDKVQVKLIEMVKDN